MTPRPLNFCIRICMTSFEPFSCCRIELKRGIKEGVTHFRSVGLRSATRRSSRRQYREKLDLQACSMTSRRLKVGRYESAHDTASYHLGILAVSLFKRRIRMRYVPVAVGKMINLQSSPQVSRHQPRKPNTPTLVLLFKSSRKKNIPAAQSHAPHTLSPHPASSPSPSPHFQTPAPPAQPPKTPIASSSLPNLERARA